MPPHSDVAGS